MTTLNIYACGGTGLNIASVFNNILSKRKGKSDDGNFQSLSNLSIYFIDTSQANLNSGISEQNFFLIEGENDEGKKTNGSGLLRKSNYEPITQSCPEILHRFKPADFNIIIHSASGGSGSVIGPSLTSELMSKGQMVIPLIVGSTSSKIEATNTMNTLFSYEGISGKHNRPILCYYQENSNNTSRHEVDERIQNAVNLINLLFVGNNKGLDYTDICNFMDFHKVTSYSPKLTQLDFFANDVVVPKGKSIISVITLTDEIGSSKTSAMVEYQKVGYVSDENKTLIQSKLPIHACAVSGHFNEVISDLKRTVADYSEFRSTHKEKGIIGSDVVTTKEGLIL